MKIDTIEFNQKLYPKFQSEGFASQFAFPFAKHFCKGKGYDIGCNRVEWSFPGSIPIDPLLDKRYDAYFLPQGEIDYIFSSHCLEHLPHWVNALDYWVSKLKSGGVLFLYLPHFDQEYWRPWNNRKHIHCFEPNILKKYLQDNKFLDKETIFVSEKDLNYSFICVASKK
jgi:SAM-dependent methyltransferase